MKYRYRFNRREVSSLCVTKRGLLIEFPRILSNGGSIMLGDSEGAEYTEEEDENEEEGAAACFATAEDKGGPLLILLVLLLLLFT